MSDQDARLSYILDIGFDSDGVVRARVNLTELPLPDELQEPSGSAALDWLLAQASAAAAAEPLDLTLNDYRSGDHQRVSVTLPVGGTASQQSLAAAPSAPLREQAPPVPQPPPGPQQAAVLRDAQPQPAPPPVMPGPVGPPQAPLAFSSTAAAGPAPYVPATSAMRGSTTSEPTPTSRRPSLPGRRGLVGGCAVVVVAVVLVVLLVKAVTGTSAPVRYQAVCVDQRTLQRVSTPAWCSNTVSAYRWFYQPTKRPLPAVGASVATTGGTFTAPRHTKVLYP